ncbi:MAG: hypothetical protein VX519_07925 [Myxococcota bacterium]|nr:hypothetical protein [Myxococcota bacterium]
MASWLQETRRELASDQGLRCLAVPEGATRLTLLAAISNNHPGEVLAVRLTGCVDAPDVVRAIGFALKLPLPGEATRVGKALATMGNILLVLEGADAPGTLQVIDNLRGLAPHVRILLGAENIHHEVPRLDLSSVLAQLPAPIVEQAPSTPTAIQSALAYVPGGVGIDELPLPAWAALPIDPHTVALRPEHRHRFLQEHLSDPQSAARVLFPYASTHLALATGGPLRQLPRHHEVLLARFLAEHLSWASDACAASATAARLLAITGQVQTALSLVQETMGRHENASESDLALLHWTQGELFLSCGLLEESQRAYQRADTGLRQVPDLRLTMLRRCADALANHALFDPANSRYQQARDLARELDDPLIHAAALRGSADLAVYSGEIKTADALYEQAEHLLGNHPRSQEEQSNLDLGRATLHLARGELREAGNRLRRAAKNAEESPQLQANIAQRGAELLLRQGQYVRAESMIRNAMLGFLHTGQQAASARCLRAHGDIHALTGRYLEAVDCYENSMAQCARTGEFRGALKALKHHLALERAGNDLAQVTRLQQLQEELEQLTSPYLDDTTGR